MFSLSITGDEIQNKLGPNTFNVKEESAFINIITDNFLSKAVFDSDGFEIIESPIISQSSFENMVFSQISFNKQTKSLRLYRSTLSGRPIYYHINTKGEFFASTHISILRKRGVCIEENTDVLPEFFIYRYVQPPQTMYKDIYYLEAGSTLNIDFIEGKCVIKSIQGLDFLTNRENLDDIKSVSQQAYNNLTKTIKNLSFDKNRIAVMLSGGLDSSILYSICKKLFSVENSYSTGYPFVDPKENTEKKYALSAAKAFGVKHHYHEITDVEYLQGIINGISAAEEPLHHFQSVLYYLLIKKGIPRSKDIIINGQGAEAVWGEPSIVDLLNLSNKTWFKFLGCTPTVKILEFVSKISGKGKNAVHLINRLKTIDLPLSDPNNFIWSVSEWGDKEWVCNYFNISKEEIIKRRVNLIQPYENSHIFDVLTISRFIGGDTITQSIWSKLAESQQKIIVYPFTESIQLELAKSISLDVKLNKPKDILRYVARLCNIPEFIISRPKSATGIRNEKWAEPGGIFEPLIPIASKVFPEKQLRSMQSSDVIKSMTLWNMLNYAIWKRLCIDNEPVSVLLEELNSEVV
jgi:asparagine synthetase B (glutamine-hydrolysing)